MNAQLRREQAGFRKGRSTVEHIFVLRNISEQVAMVEWNTSLHVCFIDFEKAFDSVHRETLWKIMSSYGIPPKLVRMIQAMYSNSKCSVIDCSGSSEWFKVRTEVKQDCVMSGFLFLLAIDWVMRRTVEKENTGIRWRMTCSLEDLDFAHILVLLSSTN